MTDKQEVDRLRISEIFFSLQGEANAIGWPTLFISLTGCPLRCGYCDTTHAFNGGQWIEIDKILQQVATYNTQHICVTGGEPLAQRSVQQLLTKLCDNRYQVSLETSGALDISDVDPRVEVVMDLKTPASGEEDKNLYQNIEQLKPSDQVKFVICDRDDYQWSKELVEKHQLNKRCQVLFSSAFEAVKPAELADWIVADQLNVRFQLQLHKILWGDVPGR